MSEKETTMMKVIVHKKQVMLMVGESLGLFTQRLGDASREHIKGKLNIANGSGGSWMVEAFGDRVVCAVYKGEDSTKYYAFTYSRDKLGKFDFGSATEVERVVTPEPKSDMVVSRATCPGGKINSGGTGRGMGTGGGSGPIGKPIGEKEEDEEKKRGDSKTKKVLGEPLEFGGWRETQKSFWMGVL